MNASKPLSSEMELNNTGWEGIHVQNTNVSSWEGHIQNQTRYLQPGLILILISKNSNII